MKKSKTKKIISLFLSLILLVTACCPVFAKTPPKNQVLTAEKGSFNDVYYDEQSYTFSDIAELSNEQIVSKTDSGFNKISKDLNQIRNDVKTNSVNNDGSVTFKTFYMERSKTSHEKRLTTNDINKINSFKAYKASNYSMLSTSGIVSAAKDVYACTIMIMATPISDGYHLAGSIEWNYPPNMFLGYQRPADGDDAVGFSWGGGYDYNSIYTSRTYRWNETNTYEYNSGTIRNINGVPDASRGWDFPEFFYSDDNAYSYYYLTRGDFQLYIEKNYFSGGTTKAYFDIVHTYNSRSYSFSIGGSPAGPSAAISVSPTNDQWSDFVEVTIRK